MNTRFTLLWNRTDPKRRNTIRLFSGAFCVYRTRPRSPQRISSHSFCRRHVIVKYKTFPSFPPARHVTVGGSRVHIVTDFSRSIIVIIIIIIICAIVIIIIIIARARFVGRVGHLTSARQLKRLKQQYNTFRVNTFRHVRVLRA